jgi:hypothetical protein
MRQLYSQVIYLKSRKKNNMKVCTERNSTKELDEKEQKENMHIKVGELVNRRNVKQYVSKASKPERKAHLFRRTTPEESIRRIRYDGERQ